MHLLTDQPYYIKVPLVKKILKYFFKETQQKTVKNTKNNRYTSCYMKNTGKNLNNHTFIILDIFLLYHRTIHSLTHQVRQTSGYAYPPGIHSQYLCLSWRRLDLSLPLPLCVARLPVLLYVPVDYLQVK